MPDLAALESALVELNYDIAEQNRRLAAQNDALDRQNVELAAVKEKLPSFVPKRQAHRAAIVLVSIVALIVAVLGVTVVLNHQTTCGIRGVLVLAQSNTARNPIPPGLSPEELERVQDQRSRAQDFYRAALGKLDVLWPCAGEAG